MVHGHSLNEGCICPSTSIYTCPVGDSVFSLKLKNLLNSGCNSDACSDLFSFLDSSHCDSIVQCFLISLSTVSDYLSHLKLGKSEGTNLLSNYFMLCTSWISQWCVLLRHGYVPNSQVRPGVSDICSLAPILSKVCLLTFGACARGVIMVLNYSVCVCVCVCVCYEFIFCSWSLYYKLNILVGFCNISRVLTCRFVYSGHFKRCRLSLLLVYKSAILCVWLYSFEWCMAALQGEEFHVFIGHTASSVWRALNATWQFPYISSHEMTWIQ